MIPDLHGVQQPTYLAGVNDVGTDDLRAMRRRCTDLENGVSYVRRMAQGRLDVLAAEVERRADGGGGDLADIVARLPELLSDGVRAPGSGRVDQDLDPPDDVVLPLTELLDKAAGPSVLAELAHVADNELAVAINALRDFEESLSTSRRSLHSTIDSLNDELARRIAAGETPATPS